MGQKTHPVGLRVGLYRKWAVSWYDAKTTSSSKFIVKEALASRGGVFVEGLQYFISTLLRRFLVTKYSSSRRFRPVDFRCFKGLSGSMFCFIIYSKLIARRRRKKFK